MERSVTSQRLALEEPGESDLSLPDSLNLDMKTLSPERYTDLPNVTQLWALSHPWWLSKSYSFNLYFRSTSSEARLWNLGLSA